MYLSQISEVTAKQRSFHLLRPGYWQHLTLALSTLISAGIYILIARSLGPHIFGGYLFAQWLAMVTIPVIGTGMSTLASRQVAAVQSRESPRLVAGIFYFLWYRQHLSILLYCLCYVMLAFTLTRFIHTLTPGMLLLAGLSTLPLLLSSVAGTTLRSLRRSDLLAMLHLFGALLTLLFVIIATRVNGQPIEAFFLAFALSNTLTLILAVICVIRLLPLEQALKPGLFLKERLTHSLRRSWLLFTLDAIVWQRSELLLLAFWYQPAELGFYALSTLICTQTINMAPTLFSQWLFPLLLRRLPEHRFLSAYDSFVRTSCYIIFLAVPISSLLIFFSPDMVNLLLGSDYLPLVQPLRILLIATVFGSIATVSLTHLATNQHAVSTRSIAVERRFHIFIACLKITLAIPLILFAGMTGAALASAIAQIASAIGSIILCKKMLMKHDSLFL